MNASFAPLPSRRAHSPYPESHRPRVNAPRHLPLRPLLSSVLPVHLKGETAFQRTRAALEIKPPQNATGREAGTLKGAAQSPFYKPGERYSPPAAHRSSARNAFPPTHSEGVHGDHGAPSLPPPQGARKAAPSAGRDRRRASVRGRTARPPPHRSPYRHRVT